MFCHLPHMRSLRVRKSKLRPGRNNARHQPRPLRLCSVAEENSAELSAADTGSCVVGEIPVKQGYVTPTPSAEQSAMLEEKAKSAHTQFREHFDKLDNANYEESQGLQWKAWDPSPKVYESQAWEDKELNHDWLAEFFNGTAPRLDLWKKDVPTEMPDLQAKRIDIIGTKFSL